MRTVEKNKIRVGKPKWLRQRLPSGPEYGRIRELIKGSNLTTVCQEAQCPNQFECFSRGTATFMILGDRCTRNCRFCAVSSEPVGLPDPEEPARVAEAVSSLQLKFAVITSVTRDDLVDGGAAHFVKTLKAIHARSPETKVEVLIPDLQGNWEALAAIMEAGPDVLNHNLETVARLYPRVRPEAVYARSLTLLKKAKEKSPGTPVKSGLMLGLGESREELRSTMRDLLNHGCDILTMGQYLQPSRDHLEVVRFVPPEEFEELEQEALSFGFRAVASRPGVRSSYEAGTLFLQVSRMLKPQE